MTDQTQVEPNVQQAVPFFWVSDMQASLRFYVDGLGFEITKRWMNEGRLCWCWLQLGGAALMLQECRGQGHDSWTPNGPVGEGVTIYILCRDALAIYAQAEERGLEPARPYVGNGMWVVSLSDPDGYKIEFESETDVPEETVYTP